MRWRSGAAVAFSVYSMTPSRSVIRSLARAFATVEFTEESLFQKGRAIISGPVPRWLRPTARFLAGQYNADSRPRFRELEERMLLCPTLIRAVDRGTVGKTIVDSGGEEFHASMRPVGGAPSTWNVPAVTGARSLAAFLGLHPDDLGWLTMLYRRPQHYHYLWHTKKGQRAKRLIEVPKPMLKAAQRIIAEDLLSSIPVHEAACGFVRGKSIFDFVKPHVGKRFVLKMDLEEFFPSVRKARVVRLLMTAGYPEYVADQLGTLLTNRVEKEVLDEANLSAQSARRLGHWHVPQGAPSSPAVANLCAFRLDCRLAGLAESAGARYTRYADDLLFSGDAEFLRQARRFHIAVLSILIEEGFQANVRKTRFMPSSQRQFAGGLVLNEKPNVRRDEFDRLKAILRNCSAHGWRGQNRESHPEFKSHLQGRIQWVAASNPSRGEKLQKVFDEIDWEGTG